MKTAFITGITGPDGSYLAELLLDKVYCVHGIVRRSSTVARSRIDHLLVDDSKCQKNIHLHYGDLADAVSAFALCLRQSLCLLANCKLSGELWATRLKRYFV